MWKAAIRCPWEDAPILSPLTSTVRKCPILHPASGLQSSFPELSLLEEAGVTRSVSLVLSSESLFLPTSSFSISPPVALALPSYLLTYSPPLDSNFHEDRDLLIVCLVLFSGLFYALYTQAFTYNILLGKWMTRLYWSKAVRMWPQNTRCMTSPLPLLLPLPKPAKSLYAWGPSSPVFVLCEASGHPHSGAC